MFYNTCIRITNCKHKWLKALKTCSEYIPVYVVFLIVG